MSIAGSSSAAALRLRAARPESCLRLAGQDATGLEQGDHGVDAFAERLFVRGQREVLPCQHCRRKRLFPKGGRGGIRTHETLARLPVFKTVPEVTRPLCVVLNLDELGRAAGGYDRLRLLASRLPGLDRPTGPSISPDRWSRCRPRAGGAGQAGRRRGMPQIRLLGRRALRNGRWRTTPSRR